jgi:hypothetical protein
MNPYIENKSMYAADYINQSESVEACVKELKEDIEYSSNNIVKCNIVKNDYLDEFATYKCGVKLLNGKSENRLDDETWLKIMSDDNGNASWYGNWDRVKKYLDTSKYEYDYGFDYDYIINKFDLVNRKNNKEFDQVWLVTISPINTYESVMVGKTAYWINGPAFIKDCNNFPIINLSIERRDANIECFGHMTEYIMNKVYTTATNSGYSYNIFSQLKYDNFNLWDKFTLNYGKFGDDFKFYGIGNLHFPPNGEYDYDWSNETKVQSTWKDWKDNYPNLTGKTVLTNCDTWLSGHEEYKDTLYAGRYHHRWWLSLFPHVSGKTIDGYSNNWWDYIITMDFAINVSPENELIQMKTNEVLPYLTFNIEYNSGKNDKVNVSKMDNNINISNKDVVNFQNGKLKTLKEGSSSVSYYVDGKKGTTEIVVSKNDNNTTNNTTQKDIMQLLKYIQSMILNNILNK